MKLHRKFPTTKLGRISLVLIVLTLFSWLFVNNAQNCLSRDFIFPPYPPAVCWRQVNDYENTIRYSQLVYLVFLGLAIICSAASLTKLKIKRSHATVTERRKTTIFLVALSTLLVIFVVTTFEVWNRTTFNNNNYFLNTTTNAVVEIGLPASLALITATIMYGLSSFRRNLT